MKYKQMLKIRKTEKDPQVRDRILLNVLVKRDGMSVTGAALHLGMAPSWGVKWHNRYLKEGIAGLQTRTRSGRPPRISGETLKAVKALSISANVVLLEAVLAVPCRPRFLWFGRFFTHSDCRRTGIGADRGSAAQRALGEGHASGACSLTTTAGCSRCFSGSAGASVAGASLLRLRRQTWP